MTCLVVADDDDPGPPVACFKSVPETRALAATWKPTDFMTVMAFKPAIWAPVSPYRADKASLLAIWANIPCSFR